MGFIYPRTISITRAPAQPDAVGDQGEAPSSARGEETSVASGLRASIQLRGRQGKNTTGLPADTDEGEWEILIPKKLCTLGTIFEGDIVTDDLGERYQVSNNYWNSLGYALRALKQKA